MPHPFMLCITLWKSSRFDCSMRLCSPRRFILPFCIVPRPYMASSLSRVKVWRTFCTSQSFSFSRTFPFAVRKVSAPVLGSCFTVSSLLFHKPLLTAHFTSSGFAVTTRLFVGCPLTMCTMAGVINSTFTSCAWMPIIQSNPAMITNSFFMFNILELYI